MLSSILHDARNQPFGVLGIDPGKSGALAVLESGKLTVRRDFHELQDIARAVRDLLDSTHCRGIVIEGVHAMPGQGVVSMFNFGTAFGVAQGAAWVHDTFLPVTFVAPLKWQNWFRKHADWPDDQPFDSRAIAVQIFPGQADLFKRKKDHNTADAVLLALWGQATI